MSTDRDTTRLVRSWLEEGATALPDRVLDAVLDQLPATPQRRLFGRLRRSLRMNSPVRYAIAAAAVIVVALVGYQFLPSNTGPGGETPVPSPTPTATLQPSPSPIAAPPLTESFTSQMHGISVSYPEGWTARAATEPWTDRPGVPQSVHPGFDTLFDPVLTDHLFLWITSRPIGDTTPEDWVAAVMEGCTSTEPIAVDGATGRIGANDCDTVAVATAGRGYEIGLLTSDDDPDAVAAYDTAWFKNVLATVQLQPEDAVDVAPSASPAP